MEKTEVVIVGAGPAGLTLALSLAKFNIHCVILEKELEITRDPRGVFLAYDAVRILWDLGLGNSLKDISHELHTVNFYTTSFASDPFHVLDINHDGFWQALPSGVHHIQPKLEFAMRKRITESPFCDLRCGCTVIGRQQEGDSLVVEYKDEEGAHRNIMGSFLVGADGKKGVVRKKILEASAGIKQVDSSYRYDGTWVAANLKLTTPTPETHPEFPLWKLGFNPGDVYDLFWPKGWHFCSPPGKATAAGRFGPHEAHFWRHEFAQPDWNDSMDAEELLWDHLTPMITRNKDDSNQPFPSGEVTYPCDCIQILRCRPYRFTHKVANKWFDDRTILIGDAAHVFPPFGGQGIASGFRDAHQLAWRIALLQRLPKSNKAFRDDLLGAWARERNQSVKDAAKLTELNGRACNQADNIFFWLLRNLVWVFNHIPFLPNIPEPLFSVEARGFMPVVGGFFSPKFGGGSRLAQIYVESIHQTPMLSDELIRRTDTVMTLLVILRDNSEDLVAEAQEVLKAVKLDQLILSEDSIRVFSPGNPDNSKTQVYFPTPSSRLAHLGIAVQSGYNGSHYIRRFRPATKFVVVRPDFYAFGLADNVEELVECLTNLRNRLQQDD